MTRVKWVTASALTGLMLVAGVRLGWCDADNSNNLDALTITIQPTIDRGVDIDTAAVSLNLGPVALYTSTWTVSPATVTILGTDNTQELNLSGVIAGGWEFDITPSTWATSGEAEGLAVFALFTALAKVDAPAGDDFAVGLEAANSKALDDGTAGNTFTAARVGGDPGDGQRFEKEVADIKDMDNLPPDPAAAAKSHLWFFLRTPSTTALEVNQNVTVTLTAENAS